MLSDEDINKLLEEINEEIEEEKKLSKKLEVESYAKKIKELKKIFEDLNLSEMEKPLNAPELFQSLIKKYKRFFIVEVNNFLCSKKIISQRYGIQDF